MADEYFYLAIFALCIVVLFAILGVLLRSDDKTTAGDDPDDDVTVGLYSTNSRCDPAAGCCFQLKIKIFRSDGSVTNNVVKEAQRNDCTASMERGVYDGGSTGQNRSDPRTRFTYQGTVNKLRIQNLVNGDEEILDDAFTRNGDTGEWVTQQLPCFTHYSDDFTPGDRNLKVSSWPDSAKESSAKCNCLTRDMAPITSCEANYSDSSNASGTYCETLSNEPSFEIELVDASTGLKFEQDNYEKYRISLLFGTKKRAHFKRDTWIARERKVRIEDWAKLQCGENEFTVSDIDDSVSTELSTSEQTPVVISLEFNDGMLGVDAGTELEKTYAGKNVTVCTDADGAMGLSRSDVDGEMHRDVKKSERVRMTNSGVWSYRFVDSSTSSGTGGDDPFTYPTDPGKYGHFALPSSDQPVKLLEYSSTPDDDASYRLRSYTNRNEADKYVRVVGFGPMVTQPDTRKYGQLYYTNPNTTSSGKALFYTNSVKDKHLSKYGGKHIATPSYATGGSTPDVVTTYATSMDDDTTELKYSSCIDKYSVEYTYPRNNMNTNMYVMLQPPRSSDESDTSIDKGWNQRGTNESSPRLRLFVERVPTSVNDPHVNGVFKSQGYKYWRLNVLRTFGGAQLYIPRLRFFDKWGSLLHPKSTLESSDGEQGVYTDLSSSVQTTAWDQSNDVGDRNIGSLNGSISRSCLNGGRPWDHESGIRAWGPHPWVVKNDAPAFGSSQLSMRAIDGTVSSLECSPKCESADTDDEVCYPFLYGERQSCLYNYFRGERRNSVHKDIANIYRVDGTCGGVDGAYADNNPGDDRLHLVCPWFSRAFHELLKQQEIDNGNPSSEIATWTFAASVVKEYSNRPMFACSFNTDLPFNVTEKLAGGSLGTWRSSPEARLWDRWNFSPAVPGSYSFQKPSTMSPFPSVRSTGNGWGDNPWDPNFAGGYCIYSGPLNDSMCARNFGGTPRADGSELTDADIVNEKRFVVEFEFSVPVVPKYYEVATFGRVRTSNEEDTNEELSRRARGQPRVWYISASNSPYSDGNKERPGGDGSCGVMSGMTVQEAGALPLGIYQDSNRSGMPPSPCLQSSGAYHGRFTEVPSTGWDDSEVPFKSKIFWYSYDDYHDPPQLRASYSSSRGTQFFEHFMHVTDTRPNFQSYYNDVTGSSNTIKIWSAPNSDAHMQSTRRVSQAGVFVSRGHTSVYRDESFDHYGCENKNTWGQHVDWYLESAEMSGAKDFTYGDNALYPRREFYKQSAISGEPHGVKDGFGMGLTGGREIWQICLDEHTDSLNYTPNTAGSRPHVKPGTTKRPACKFTPPLSTTIFDELNL